MAAAGRGGLAATWSMGVDSQDFEGCLNFHEPFRALYHVGSLAQLLLSSSTAKVRYSVGPLVGRGPTASCSGVMMSEPTVDEIMEKAKQLCRLDGMLWSKLDFQNPMAQQIRTTARLAGEAVRRRYLKRRRRCSTRKPDVRSLEARSLSFPALHRSGRTIAQIALHRRRPRRSRAGAFVCARGYRAVSPS